MSKSLSKEVEVKEVVLKIGDKEIHLSLKEAKELMSVLYSTFGQKPYTIPWVWEYPYPPNHPYPGWMVTCESTSETLTINNSTSQGVKTERKE